MRRQSQTKTFIPEDFQEEITWNWKQLCAFLSVIVFASIYLFSYVANDFFDKKVYIHIVVNQQFLFLFSDWNLILSFGILIALTLGWYLLQYVSILLIHLQIQLGVKIGRKKGAFIRYYLAVYLSSLIVSHFIFKYKFNDGMLWVAGVFVSAFLSLIFFALIKLKDQVFEKKDPLEKLKRVIAPTNVFDPELKAKYMMYVALLIFCIICTIVFHEELLLVWQLVTSNVLSSILLTIVLLTTVFWRPLCFLISLLYQLPYKIALDPIKRKINRYRILLLIFVISMLLTKNIHFFQELIGLTTLQVQLISFIVGMISSISGYLFSRKYFPISI